MHQRWVLELSPLGVNKHAAAILCQSYTCKDYVYTCRSVNIDSTSKFPHTPAHVNDKKITPFVQCSMCSTLAHHSVNFHTGTTLGVNISGIYT